MHIEARIGETTARPTAGIEPIPRNMAKSAIMCAVTAYRHRFGHPQGHGRVTLDHCILEIDGKHHNLGELPSDQAQMEVVLDMTLRQIYAAS